MSLSRWLNLLGAVGAAASAIALSVGELNPKLGAVLTIIGLALTVFNDRLHGGSSKKEDVE